MCGKCDCDVVVSDIDIRMMIVGVRQSRDPVHEDNCVSEGTKTETLNYLVRAALPSFVAIEPCPNGFCVELTSHFCPMSQTK